ncbi:MAG: ribulose-phosphate 3-epimerase [Spirochaetia bacterium]|nr:ribulose-phosphate 3-epimerase [Spirochaetia bacterium]
MIELCASLLAADHAHIARDIAAAQACGIERFHVDVCDGHYARPIIFGDQLVERITSLSSAFFDVHLAVYHMASILETFIAAGPDMITVQYESCSDHLRLIDTIHASTMLAGICIVPETPVEEIEHLLSGVDAVNVLAVNPGIGGQPFQHSVLKKVEQLVKLRTQRGFTFRISVDGGVNERTITDVISAGADIAIAGSAIFSGSIEENVQRMLQCMQHTGG